MNHRLADLLFAMLLRLRLPLLWLLTLGAAFVSLAHDLSQYHLGDQVEEEIIAPRALTVPDPEATGALKAALARQTPAVFLNYPDLTNSLNSQFQVAFQIARSNFISTLQESFHVAVLDHALIDSPDYGYLLTAYNSDHPDFPLPADLAMDWAYGKDGSVEESKWINDLIAIQGNLIGPDTLPDEFKSGPNVRLIAVDLTNQVFSGSDLAKHGQLIPLSQIAPLSEARQVFKREFEDGKEPLLARALANWLQANCIPDDTLTKMVRSQAMQKIIAAEVYSPGQVIASKGTVVDTKILSAIQELSQTYTTLLPGDQETNPTHSATDVSHLNRGSELAKEESAFTTNQKMIALAGFIGLIILVAANQFRPKPKNLTALTASTPLLPPPSDSSLQTEIAPQILKVVRQAFVNELADQRQGLISNQQVAAAEVVELVHRMDALQIAMQERMRTYESQIQQLEAELTARKEENQQLIRLKIQMIRQQARLENQAQRVDWN